MKIFANKKTYATLNNKTSKKEKIRDIEKNINKVRKNEKINIWRKCPNCNEILYNKDITENFEVCPKCHMHLRLKSMERIEFLIDKGSFEEFDKEMQSIDFLNFPEYTPKIEKALNKNKTKNAAVSGIGEIKGKKVSFAIMDFNFIGGSMGVVVGEKITRTFERALKQKIPAIIVTASGGARMQEGMMSLMQMAKTSGAILKLKKAGIPYIVIITNPTTGGVTASFAMLGDVIISEPGTLIGFSGPRLIEQITKQKLPENFQTAEFLLERGMIDMIIDRRHLKSTIYKLIDNFGF